MPALRSLAVACAAATALLVPATAHAALDWSAPVSLPAGLSRLALAPDGTGLLLGFATNRTRMAVRPKGGAVGDPQTLPPELTFDSFDVPFAAFTAAGDALLASNKTGRVAFRPAGAASAIGTAQSIGAVGAPVAIAITTTGEALIGADVGSGTAARVAFRPAGAAAMVDTVGYQDFGPGRTIGVALDPDGGAVAVFRDGLATYQSVRAPGQASFGAPTEIKAAGLNASEYQIQMATAPTGHAILYWIGGTNTSTLNYDRAMGAYRAPGGAFGPPQVLGTTPIEISNVRGAITDGGDAIVGWTSTTFDGACSPGDRYDFGAFASFLHAGAFGGAVALGSSSFPEESTVLAVRAAGTRAAVALELRHLGGGERCDVKDNRSDITLTTYTANPNGLAVDGSLNVGTAVPSGLPPDQSQWRHPSLTDVSIAPSGGVLVAYRENQKDYLRAREDLTPTHGDPTITPTPTPTPTPGGGTTTTAPTIKPIVPKDLISVRPLSADKPDVTVFCPPQAGSECLVHIAMYQAFGIVPKPSAAKAPKAKLLASIATKRVKPGKKATVRLRLTKAGRKAAKTRSVKVRIVVSTRIAGKLVSYTAKTTLKPAKKRG